MSALAETTETHLAERVELLRAIHDGPVQELFGTALTLDSLAEEHGEDVRLCAETVRRVLGELRVILDQATPSRRRVRGERNRVEHLAAALREAAIGVALHLELDALVRVPPAALAAVEVFVAEGLRNARKHAHPACIDVCAAIDSDVLHIRVENDGLRPVPNDPGIGLRLLALEADQLGGSVSAQRLEERWQLTLTLPLPGARRVPCSTGQPAGES